MSGGLTSFRVEVPQAELDDLKTRLARTRWPEPDDSQSGDDWSLGAPTAALRALVEHWHSAYDWRAAEAAMNAYPQHLAQVDGTRVHLFDVRSPHPGALPLVLTHGWPSSPVEFLDLVGPLTDPPAYGGRAEDAFDVVIPTLPGFGFSGPTTGGWEPRRTAAAWAEVMARLGHRRYVASGSDWGAAVTRELGILGPSHVAAIHVTAVFGAGARHTQDAATADPDVRRSLARAERFEQDLSGYFHLQARRPASIGAALTDSPVGQLAWLAQPFHDWRDPASVIDADTLLTTVMQYWLTRTAASSARWYVDGADTWARTDPACPVPMSVAVLPHDLLRPLRERVERTNRLERWTEYPRGGHFPALEVPLLLVEDLRDSFRGHR